MELSVFDGLLEEDKKINLLLEQLLKASGLDGVKVKALFRYPKCYLDISIGQLEKTAGGIGDDQSVSFPIYYHDKNIGQLRCSDRDGVADFFYQHRNLTTEKIGLLFKRLLTDSVVEKALGRGQYLLGMSDALTHLDLMLYRVSQSKCPVMILTEPGGESLAAATAIHYYSDLRDKPFVECNCAVVDDNTFRNKLLNCIEKAGKGTLFLSELDKLSVSQQEILLELFSVSSHNPDSRIVHFRNIRLIASAGVEIESKISNEDFPRRIYDELSFITIRVPALKQRREDIAYLANMITEKFRVNPKQFINAEALKILSSYDWPGNYQQLERCIAQLLVLSSNVEINRNDIEQFVGSEINSGLHCDSRYQDGSGYINIAQDDDKQSRKKDVVLQKLLEGDFSWFECYHYSLKRALEFICNNYNSDINLKQLANYACVSPSHLSYLFRTNISKSFKQVLTEIRLEKAKQMLKRQPSMRITEVSLESGFGDLSHFEKTFKRHTGLTPRDFKGKAKASFRADHNLGCI